MGTDGKGSGGGGAPTMAEMNRNDFQVTSGAIDRTLGIVVRNIQNSRAAPDPAAFQRGVQEALDSALARGDNNEFFRGRSLPSMATQALNAADRAQRAGNMARASRFRGRASAYLQAAQRLVRREARIGGPQTEGIRGFARRVSTTARARGLNRGTRQALSRKFRTAPVGRQAAQVFRGRSTLGAAREAARAGGLGPAEQARNARRDAELAAIRISDALARGLTGGR